jgi:hypothetical protein
MKKIVFLVALVILAATSFSQVKISDFNLYTGSAADSAVVPIVLSNSNRKVYLIDLFKQIQNSPTYKLGIGITPSSRITIPAGTTATDGIRFGDIDLYRNADAWLTSSATFYSVTDIRTPAVANPTSANNAQVTFGTDGVLITRNVQDANPALIVQLSHASSTAPIIQFKNSSTIVGSLSKVGVLQLNNYSTGYAKFDGTGILTSNSVIPISDITGLVAALGAKSDTGHTHTQAQVTSLVSDLAAKVPTARTLTINGTAYDLTANRSWTIESITDTSSLSTRINSKLNISDTATMLSPYAKTSALAGKLNISDTATMLSPYLTSAEIGDKLNTSDTAAMLSGYSRTSHTHTIANVTGLQAAIDGKQAADADLTTISALSTASNDVIMQVKSNAWSVRTPAQFKVDLALVKADVGLGSVENTAVSTWPGTSNITTVGTITAGTWNATAIAINKGGTGVNAWVLGDLLYGSGTNSTTILPGNTTTTKLFLSQTGTGTVSASPVWSAVSKTDVGLDNVDNTSDATKNSATATLTNKTISGSSNTISNIAQSSITNLTSDLGLKAPLASPAFTGTPTAPTAVSGTNTTQIATTAFVAAAIASGGITIDATPTNASTNAVQSDGVFDALALKLNISDTATMLSGYSRTSHTHTIANVTSLQTTLDGKQPLDTDLTTIAGLSTSSNDVIMQVKANAWTVRTPAQVKTDLALVKGDVGLGNVENTALSTWAGSSNITTLGTVATGTWNATAIAINKGGSGVTSRVLGDIVYGSGSNTTATLAGNTSSSIQFLSQTGTGAVSAAPAWTTLTKTHVGLSNVDNTSDANKPISTATQAALDGKISSVSPALTGTPTAPTASTGTSTTQIATTAFVNASISANSQPLDADLTTIAGLTPTTDNFIVSVASAWASRTPAQVKTTLALNNVENTALSTWTGATSITTLGTIATGTWNATTIGTTKGGTGLTSYATGDLIYASASNTLAKLTGNITTAKQYLSQTGSGSTSAAPVWAAIAQADVTNLTSDLALKAPLASPTFTGTPTLPTGTIATTQSAGNNTTAVATTAFVNAERTNTATLTNKTMSGSSNTFSNIPWTALTGSPDANLQLDNLLEGKVNTISGELVDSFIISKADGDYWRFALTESGLRVSESGGTNASLNISTHVFFDSSFSMPGATQGYFLVADENGRFTPQTIAIPVPNADYGDILVNGSSWTITQTAKDNLWATAAENITGLTIDNFAPGALEPGVSSLNPEFSGTGIFSGISELASSSYEQFVLGGTITHTGTAQSTQLFISPYIVSSGSGGSYLFVAGTRSAEYPSGVHTNKFVLQTDGLVWSAYGFGTSALSRPTTNPAVPVVYFDDDYGKSIASQKSNTGIAEDDYSFQAALHDVRVAWNSFQCNTGGLTNVGLALGNSGAGGVSSVTSVGVTNARYFTITSRAGLRTATSAADTQMVFGNGNKWMLSNIAGAGGFLAQFNFGAASAATVDSQRVFAGLYTGTTGIPDQNPINLLDCIVLGYNSGDATYSIFHNDGSGTATKISLGSNFPANTLSTDWYKFIIYAKAGDVSQVRYKVIRMNKYHENVNATTYVAEGTITTNLPTTNRAMNWWYWVSNGNTASGLSAGIDMSQTSIQTLN